jgi:flagellar basal body-associated protein FliL
MSRTRFRIVFILLVLILLAASAVFGVLTYWLGADQTQPEGDDMGVRAVQRESSTFDLFCSPMGYS